MLLRTASAQVLELGEVVEPPVLDRFTYTGNLIGTLEREIAERLGQERGATPIEKLALQASVNIRVMAADMLGTGDRAVGSAGSGAILAGLTLAQGREAIDDAMHEFVALSKRLEQSSHIAPDDQQRLRTAIDSIRLFNERAVANAGDLRTTEITALDGALASLLAPLADAVTAIERASPRNHWISTALIKPTPAMTVALPSTDADAAKPSRTLPQIRAELATLSLREDTKAELDGIIDFLERGSAFPELRPQVDASLHHIAQVADLLRSLEAATWLDEESRANYLDRLHLGIVLFKDPRTRDRGQRYLDRLEASHIIIDRITALIPLKVRIDAIREAFLSMDNMVEDPAQADVAQSQLRRLEIVLARMLAYRDLGKADLRRDLTVVERQLDLHYQQAEKRLLTEIEMLTTNPGALADPAFASLMQDQQNYLSDVQRVRTLPAWVETMRLVDPDSAGPFHQQTRKMATWLLDTNRRPDALQAMEQFEQQLGLFWPLPFEAELRSAAPAALEATGGMHEQLLRVIDSTRRDWARAWANGDAGSAEANELLLLHRLLQTMADTAHVLDHSTAPVALNRWAAWELSAPALARSASDLPGRLKLATHAANEERFDALAQQLSEIDRDAPVAKLLGRLAQVVGPGLADLPDTAIGPIAELTLPPPRDAWWLRKRDELATLCRYINEAEYARSTKRGELLEELTIFVNSRAEDLLAELGERRSKIPTLIGFDGSDPNPDVEMPERVQPLPRRR